MPKIKILTFFPDQKEVDAGVRPYNLYKSLRKQDVEIEHADIFGLSDILNHKIISLFKVISFVIRNKHSSNSFFLIENVINSRFLKFLKLFNIPIILDIRDEKNLQAEGYGIPLDKSIKENRKLNTINNLKSISHGFVVSKSYYDYYPEEFWDKLHVVPNASDPAHFVFKTLPSKNVVGILTGATPGRGNELFLDAAIRVKKVIPDLRVKIGWKTYPHSDYDKRIKSKYSMDWISFYDNISYSSNAPAFYSSLKVGVISHTSHSYFDSLSPVKLFDIMAAGRPVLATQRYETSKIITETNCGLICNDSVLDMSEKLIQLLLDSKMSSKLGKNGRNAVIKIHNWESRASDIIKTIKN